MSFNARLETDENMDEEGMETTQECVLEADLSVFVRLLADIFLAELVEETRECAQDLAEKPFGVFASCDLAREKNEQTIVVIDPMTFPLAVDERLVEPDRRLRQFEVLMQLPCDIRRIHNTLVVFHDARLRVDEMRRYVVLPLHRDRLRLFLREKLLDARTKCGRQPFIGIEHKNVVLGRSLDRLIA